MWILLACASAFFAGLTSILAKCGIKKTDSNVATAIRTIVVLIFSWIMVFIVGSQNQIGNITLKTLAFLILSGLATGASWLCYFKALSIGNVNKVVAVDKSSVVLTLILAFIVLGEKVTVFKILGIILIGVGTFMMIVPKKESKTETNKTWLIFAILSAVFAALTAILGKIGISGVESNLGTAIRTIVVLIMAWMVVGVTGKKRQSKNVDSKELVFICLSGLATGASWLCYFKALQGGVAGIVVSIDKLSILVSVGFSYIFFKEKLSKRGFAGLMLLIVGTLAMVAGEYIKIG